MPVRLERTHKYHPLLKQYMDAHYSQPRGFVGRSVCYFIKDGFDTYGAIVGGSATLHLAGRDNFIPTDVPLENIVNNIFYHAVRFNGEYPLRNFTVKILAMFREQIKVDWKSEYGNEVKAFETLVELPRTGEIYKRDGWREVGRTKGFTCKRTAGVGSDTWTGRRVWDTENLRPKRVFCRMAD